MTTTSDRRLVEKRDREPIVFSPNARVVLERRYLAKDDHGQPVETPEDLVARVAYNLAKAELNYKPLEDVDGASQWGERFYEMMASLDFLPNSPTLMNAGRDLQQLAACFVIPVSDSIDGIFDALKAAALIHKSGGGTGFGFSRLRPEGDRVQSSMGIASGPVSFMKVFDAATEQIKQGGTRRGANMAILSVSHPDIEEFVDLKADMTTLTNFNISVGASEAFMEAVKHERDWPLVNPRSGEVVRKVSARVLFRKVVENAWRNGDPGLVFLDRMNRAHACPHLGEIEATNPCGEVPLPPWGVCTLGSINLSRFVTGPTGSDSAGRSDGQRKVDFDRLAQAVPPAVRFLDNVIDMNRYPLPQIRDTAQKARKIGLGVMGFADMLFQLRVPYASEEALKVAEGVMRFIQQKANDASLALGEERGVFPAWEGSVYDPATGDPRSGYNYRNSSRTTIAPTGTISIIADCSSGIEPLFSLAFTRQHFLDPKDPSKLTQLTEVNKHFLQVARDKGFYSEELMEYLAGGGKLSERPEVPQWVKDVFVTAHDISPEWHVRMQGAFQKYTDDAVSKTINFPVEATVDDVGKAYWLAYELGCKGITIYREGSRDWSVLSHAVVNVKGPEQEPEDLVTETVGAVPQGPRRRRLPDERQSITHKFAVGEQEGYLTVGLYEDGRPGEIFVKIAKEGSTVSGLMDTVALLTSVSMQYGVPLEDLARKLKNTRFEPYGRTNNKDIPWSTSLVDYIFRWLELKFVPGAAHSHDGLPKYQNGMPVSPDSSGLGCPDCGSILIYQEGCLVCRACGYNKCG